MPALPDPADPSAPDAAPRSATDAWARGEAALAAGRPQSARAAYQELASADPGHAGAWLRLATLATGEGRYRDAVAAQLGAAAARIDDAELLLTLAGTLQRTGEAGAAEACLRHPAVSGSREPGLLERAAQAALQLDDTALALRLLDARDRLEPASPGAEYARATALLFDGHLDAAGELLERCIARAPGLAAAHWSLARLRRQTPASNHVDRLRRVLAAGPPPAARPHLGFALFKELDDLDDTAGAWEALAAACAAKRAQPGVDPAGEGDAFEALHALWPADAGAAASDAATRAAAEAPAEGEGGPEPVFIVGMPRTGTTLLERLLAGVDGVRDAGELDDLPLQLRWLGDRFSRSFLDAEVFRAAAAQARRAPGLLARRYRGHAARRAGDGRWFTDKLPMNFLNVGFIAEAFPRAPILHMTRNPMDTCFSNLKELFTTAYPYSYRLDELADHYGRYRRLMARWHASFPGRILDVPYEGLVQDPDGWRARVLAHCGMDPAAAASPAATLAAGGAVTTASSVQVREPIHTRGVEAWRRYATPLEPLRRRLAADGWIAP